MKVIIDAYRGGTDTGININNKYEKDLLLDLSNYLKNELNKYGINNYIIRNGDISLSDDDRISLVNDVKDNDDIIISNRYLAGDGIEIVYPLRSNDTLANIISSNLTNNGINVNKYYQRRLPLNTINDYYSVIRDTSPNETIIIFYNDLVNYKYFVPLIAESIYDFVNQNNSYKVKSGDTLYKIASKYDISVKELKEYNNLVSDNLSVGEILFIPKKSISKDKFIYIVEKGDTLYKIANSYGVSVDSIKEVNKLTSDNISIGSLLEIPSNIDIKNDEYINYIVKKGDSLYSISRKYNTSVDELKKINNLGSNILNIGDELKVPNNIDMYSIYEVKKGDSLYKIAINNNTSVDEIKKLNNISSNIINIGDKLKIPR